MKKAKKVVITEEQKEKIRKLLGLDKQNKE